MSEDAKPKSRVEQLQDLIQSVETNLQLVMGGVPAEVQGHLNEMRELLKPQE